MAWVFDQSQATHDTRLVMLALANVLDQYGRHGWPSHGSLAKAAKVDERTVRRVLDKARELGEVDWIDVAGRVKAGRSRRLYWFPTMLGDRPAWDEEIGERFGLTPDQLSGVNEGRHRTAVRATPDNGAADTGQPRPPYKEEPPYNPPLDPSFARPTFDDFWKLYPRHTAKGAARASWDKRVKAGADPRELVERAGVYAEWCDRAGQEPRFIPHASTWLNQERDADDLPDAARMRNGNNGNGRGHKYDVSDAWDEIRGMVKNDAGRVGAHQQAAVRKLPGD